MRILITGGSGFIGTNLIDFLVDNLDCTILNIDIKPPKIERQNRFWKKIDIRDFSSLRESITIFNPEIIVHLAARTDLNGKTLDDYSSNTIGVENLLKVLAGLESLKRVVFTSSMYVCYPGYLPKDDYDYAPHTIYGESKVITEKLIREYKDKKYCWSITRPTSIWGPWFDEPYSNFFRIVMARKFFHMGDRSCTKTYGYIGNTVYQIKTLLESSEEKINLRTFYLGDLPSYNISEWADEIASAIGIEIMNVPFYIFKIGALFGDSLKLLGIKFPMTSFRLRNMTTDNIHNVSAIMELTGELPYSRPEGVEQTINWIKNQWKK